MPTKIAKGEVTSQMKRWSGEKTNLIRSIISNVKNCRITFIV